MKKIALISDGWKRLITYAWVEGIVRRIRELDEDISLFQYNCFGNWNKDELHNTGEYNIYNLPDLSEFEGIILDCSNITDEAQRERTISRIRDSGRPVVTIDCEVDGFYYVGEDNYTPVRELMHHLYEDHGCRSFVFAGGPAESFSNRQRAGMYRACIVEFGLELEDNPVYSGDFDYETGVRYMKEFVAGKRSFPDAFVCANDNIAAGLCAQAQKYGYQIPKDFLVTGFDNLDKAMYFLPQITTVNQERERIGATCIDILLGLWSGKKMPMHTYVPSECIYSESCGCPNCGLVDYRQYVKDQIVYNVTKSADDSLLVDLEAEMAKYSRFEDIFSSIVEYFEKLQCDGVYIVVDQKLFAADADTVFPVEGYDWENLVVAGGFEDQERTQITDVDELYRHLEAAGPANAYMFTPIHFKQQAVGYMILKNGRFLYDNPYYFDIHSAILKALETQFRQNQLQKAVQKLQELYNRDPLTGIYNRIAYTDMIRPAFFDYSSHGIVCALVFVDADNFKLVNDTYGHEFGDQVLTRIAAVMSEECPQKGYVCRYGGDEFIAFFPYATPVNAGDYMERVQLRLQEEHIGISMGLKLTHAGIGDTLDEYLSLADQDMYEQKQARKKLEPGTAPQQN